MDTIIPHILHIYWGGGPLSYLQYLTFKTFKIHNPTWEIWLWGSTNPNSMLPTWETGEQEGLYTGKDYLDKAKELCIMKEIDMGQAGVNRDIHEVYKSDFTRHYVLYEYGGVYCDVDFLFVKPIDSLLEDNFDYLLSFGQFFQNGFLVAKPKQRIVQDCVIENTRLINDNRLNNYQALGNLVFNRLFTDDKIVVNKYPESKIYNVPMDVIYPYTPCSAIAGDDDVYEMFYGTKDKTTENTIGMHWFNGHPLAKKYQNGFDEYVNNGSIVSRIAKGYYVLDNITD